MSAARVNARRVEGQIGELPLPVALYAANIAARATVVGGLVPAVIFLVSILIAYVASADAARWSWLALFVLGVGDQAARTRRDASDT